MTSNNKPEDSTSNPKTKQTKSKKNMQPDDPKTVARNSGNHFHSKVATTLKQLEWNITISPYYLDPVQDKPREVDLIAEKTWEVSDKFGRTTGVVLTRLVVECKYSPETIIFWFSAVEPDRVKDIICRRTKFKPGNSYTDRHHYLSNNSSIAKLFASQKDHGPSPFYSAINQVLHSTESLRSYRPWPLPSHPQSNVLDTLEFPVVFLNSFKNLYQLEMLDSKNLDQDPDPKQIEDHFLFEVDYTFPTVQGNHSREVFLIDIVNFVDFRSFLSQIEEDAKAAVQVVSPH